MPAMPETKPMVTYEDSAAVISSITEEEGEEDAPLLPRTSAAAYQHARIKLPARAVSTATLLGETSDGGGLDARQAYLHEAGRLMALTLPLVATSMSSFLVGMVGIVFVGHLGKFELSVAVLAASIFNVTGLSFLLGSLGALETLCSQAYGGKNYREVGVALQRAVLFTLTLTALVIALWAKGESLLLILGQEASLAAGAAKYLHWCSPALACVAVSECLKRYLTAQNIVAPSTIASFIAMLTAPLFNWLMVSRLKWGLFGAAMAGNCAQATPLIVLVIWIMRRERKLKEESSPELTWYGWSKEALQNWGAYLKLALPSAAMVCLEWSTFEACVLLSGLLNDPEANVAVMGLTLNVSGLLYMLPSGLGSAISVRVGNALGAGLPRGAARAAHVSMAIAITMQVTLGLILLASRHVAAYLFTQDEGIASASAAIFPIMAWCLLGDGINATVAGVLRGAGRQELGAIYNLIAYWVVGLPLASLLAFKAKLGVYGLWIGLATCASLNGCAMGSALVRMNWQREAQRATGRPSEGGENGENEGLEFAEFGRFK